MPELDPSFNYSCIMAKATYQLLIVLQEIVMK